MELTQSVFGLSDSTQAFFPPGRFSNELHVIPLLNLFFHGCLSTLSCKLCEGEDFLPQFISLLLALRKTHGT